jgi:hypothetical protein
VLQKALDIVGLTALIAPRCGPQAAAIAAMVGITIAALKLIDQGDGIILTRPMWVGPIIPTPQ